MNPLKQIFANNLDIIWDGDGDEFIFVHSSVLLRHRWDDIHRQLMDKVYLRIKHQHVYLAIKRSLE